MSQLYLNALFMTLLPKLFKNRLLQRWNMQYVKKRWELQVEAEDFPYNKEAA